MAWAGGRPSLFCLRFGLLEKKGEPHSEISRGDAVKHWQQMVCGSVAVTGGPLSNGTLRFVFHVVRHVAGQNSRFATRLRCGVTHAGSCFRGG